MAQLAESCAIFFFLLLAVEAGDLHYYIRILLLSNDSLFLIVYLYMHKYTINLPFYNKP